MRANGIRFYGKGGPTLGDREIGGRKEPDDSCQLPTTNRSTDRVGALKS